jgi:hypothetical protein
MPARGSKVERNSVSEQPYELKYEAKKTSTSAKEVEAAKKSESNKRSALDEQAIISTKNLQWY